VARYYLVVSKIVLDYLNLEFTHPIRDPLWKHIYLTRGMEKLLQTSPFARLGRIRQLGLAFQVYPGAVHTRLNHSLGVFHLAKRMIQVLLNHPQCPVLTLEGVKAFLVACLAHDLGHFPYAHVFEDSIRLTDHEELSAEALLLPEVQNIVREDIGTDPYLAASIVNTSLPLEDRIEETNFYRSLLSGVLDPDKLDYLNRDAYFCGIPYGIQDTDFIISQMVPLPSYQIALTTKGIMSVENVLFSKYLMYRSVYWHKGVRAPSSIIRKTMEVALRAGILKDTDLYFLDDYNFASTLSKIHPSLDIVGKAEVKGSYLTLYEEPFDENSLVSSRFSDPDFRIGIEDRLAKDFSKVAGRTVLPQEVALDIPRSLSFEVQLPILRGKTIVPFPESGTVFGKEVVASFTQVLKRVRVCGPKDLLGKIGSPGALLAL